MQCFYSDHDLYGASYLQAAEIVTRKKLHYRQVKLSRRRSGLIVPTHFSGGGTIYSNGFFLFRQFWPIDIIIVESCEWYH